MMTEPIPQMPGETDIAAAALAAQQAAQQRIDATPPGETGQPMATESDIRGLVAQMQAQMAQMAQQMQDLQAGQAAQGPHPLLATARQLVYHLKDSVGHETHEPAAQLAEDLVDAAGNAVTSGELGAVTSIIGRLAKWADRNPPPPGESYHARQVADLVRFHLPDQVDSFVPAPKSAAISGGQPVKVIEGSVTG